MTKKPNGKHLTTRAMMNLIVLVALELAHTSPSGASGDARGCSPP